jgi:hypothetical protein
MVLKKKNPSESKLEMWSNKSGLEMTPGLGQAANQVMTVDINNRFKKSEMSFH